MNKKLVGLLVVLLVLVGATAVMAQGTVPLNPSHVGATNPGFEVDSCPTPPEGQEGWWGWHFVMPGNNFTSLTVTFQTAGTFSANPFPGDVFVAHPHNQHAYIWTPTSDTLLAGSATSDGSNTFFNLSHVCAGPEDYEELTVTKTADTAYTRTHDWSIAKSVDPTEMWLYIDGSGDATATWTVDVAYEDYEDSGWNVSGDITIENTGTLDAEITSVNDVLAGTSIDVDCGVTFPHTLSVGETLTCTYSEDGYVEGSNVVTVTTERDEYSANADIIWGDPTTEINKTVNIEDISDLFGTVALGTVTAPNGHIFTYDKHFVWADYGADNCGSYTYNNTATIVETGQSASAVLKVNVQCYIYETAYAKGDPATCFIGNGFNNWGWTNPIGPSEYTWDLWAAAGQCDTSKGALVGSVTVVYDDDGDVTVTYNVGAPYSLKETHVYAGTTMFPVGKNGKPTVAPGQYYNDGPFDGGQVYVIAHAVVGIPDPNFGP
jgi:hypothetical protein